MKKEHRDTAVYVMFGVGGVAMVGLLVSHQQPSQQQRQVQQKTPMVSNPGNASIIQAIIAARTNALDMYDTSVLGEKSLQEQQDVAYNQDLAQREISFNTNKTQLQETNLETAMQQAIANIQAQEQEQVAQTEMQPEEQYVQNQGNNWWQNILGGIFSGFGGIF